MSPQRRCRFLQTPVIIRTLAGPPHALQHETDPGTLTASNTRFAKTVIERLDLVLRDRHGNATGRDCAAQVAVTIESPDECLKSSEIPIFDKNKGALHFEMRRGRVTLKVRVGVWILRKYCVWADVFLPFRFESLKLAPSRSMCSKM